MRKTIDLVADVGESYGHYTIPGEEELLPVLTSANVACGFHAGDPQVIDATVRRCVELGVAVGAHPSFPDRVGFGRRDMGLSAHEVYTDVLYQIGALSGIARAHGVTLQHVSPHGKLGNLIEVRADYASAVLDAVEAFDPGLTVLGLGGEILAQAEERGLRSARICVIDRGYSPEGQLVPRGTAGDLIHDSAEIAARAVRLITEGVVESVGGQDIAIEADTLLLHGDTPESVRNAQEVRRSLEGAGVELVSFGRSVG